MKYIITEINGLDYPFIFNEILNHSDIARIVPGKVVSAGFIRMYEELCCHGKSTTLKMESREEDTEIIKRQLDGYRC